MIKTLGLFRVFRNLNRSEPEKHRFSKIMPLTKILEKETVSEKGKVFAMRDMTGETG